MQELIRTQMLHAWNDEDSQDGSREVCRGATSTHDISRVLRLPILRASAALEHCIWQGGESVLEGTGTPPISGTDPGRFRAIASWRFSQDL